MNTIGYSPLDRVVHSLHDRPLHHTPSTQIECTKLLNNRRFVELQGPAAVYRVRSRSNRGKVLHKEWPPLYVELSAIRRAAVKTSFRFHDDIFELLLLSVFMYASCTPFAPADQQTWNVFRVIGRRG